MRLIDADALKRKYEEQAAIEHNKHVAPASWSDAFETVAEDIEMAVIDYGWISVKDKLPMLMESVLFTGQNYYGSWFLAQRGYYDGTFWHSDNNGTVYATTPVTHWMPLPEPPVEVDGDD